ncbi:hypothetical protein M3J09_004774 [Ascochyta lentis]
MAKNMAEVRRHLTKRPHALFIRLCKTCNEDILDEDEFKREHGPEGELCHTVHQQRKGDAGQKVQWQMLYDKLKGLLNLQEDYVPHTESHSYDPMNLDLSTSSLIPTPINKQDHREFGSSVEAFNCIPNTNTPSATKNTGSLSAPTSYTSSDRDPEIQNYYSIEPQLAPVPFASDVPWSHYSVPAFQSEMSSTSQIAANQHRGYMDVISLDLPGDVSSNMIVSDESPWEILVGSTSEQTDRQSNFIPR